MKYSSFFSAETKSSKSLLGTTYFGSSVSKEDAFAMMDHFYELGGTHLDTARWYSEGHSEEIIGEWVKSRKATDVLVSTKGGFYDIDAGEPPRMNEKDIRQDLEESLKALGTDTINFYWVHKDDIFYPVEKIVCLMNDLVNEGKIRNFGVSNWSRERIERANQFAEENNLRKIAASQIRFNPANCFEERGGHVGMDNHEFQFYKATNMPVVAYSSQAKGFFSKMERFGEAGLSEKAKKRYYSPENVARFKVIKGIADEHGCSVAAIINAAYASFTTPEVFAIIGPTSFEQLEDTLSGADITLTNAELKAIFAFDM